MKWGWLHNLNQPKSHFCESKKTNQINVHIWKTAHLPFPYINLNPNLLSVDWFWVKGGVGMQLLGYWH